MTTTLAHRSPIHANAIAGPLLQRLTAWFAPAGSSLATQHHTRDSAAMLYARSARYEATQPGFAADLRAAAEAMERSASKTAR